MTSSMLANPASSRSKGGILGLLALVLAALVGCGSGGGNPSSPLAGVWAGTYLSGGSGGSGGAPVYAVVLGDGTIRLLFQQQWPAATAGGSSQNAWFQVAGNLGLSGGTLNGSGTGYLPSWLVQNNGLASSYPVTLGGSATSTAMALTVTVPTTATQGVTVNLALTPYDVAPLPVSGSFNAAPGATSENKAASLTFTTDGKGGIAFGGADERGQVSQGALARTGVTSAFTAAYQYADSTAPTSQQPFHGLSFAASGPGGQGALVVVMANSGASGYAAIFTQVPPAPAPVSRPSPTPGPGSGGFTGAGGFGLPSAPVPPGLPAPIPAPALASEGIWFQTLPSGATFYLLVLPGGQLKGLYLLPGSPFNLTQFSGVLQEDGGQIAGSCVLIPPGNALAAPLGPGNAAYPLGITGSVAPDALTLSLIDNLPGSGPNPLQPLHLTRLAESEVAMPLADLQGDYDADDAHDSSAEDTALTSVTLNPADGSQLLFTGADAAGTYSQGVLASLPDGPSHNAFATSFAYSPDAGKGAPDNPIGIDGLAFAIPSSTPGGNPTLVVMADDGQIGEAGIFTPVQQHPAPEPSPLAGAWTGVFEPITATAPDAANAHVWCMVLPDGSFRLMTQIEGASPYFLQFSGQLALEADPSAGQNTVVTGQGQFRIPGWMVDATGALQVQTFVVHGSTRDNGMDLVFTVQGETGTSDLQLLLGPDTEALAALPLSTLQGTVTSVPGGTSSDSPTRLTFAGNPAPGSLAFTGGDLFGTIPAGLLTPAAAGSNPNALNVQFTYDPNPQPDDLEAPGTSTFSGLAYVTRGPSPANPAVLATTLVVMADNGPEPASMLFVLP